MSPLMFMWIFILARSLQMKRIVILCLWLCPFVAAIEARPVSYPGGWTWMFMHDGLKDSIHIHYSPTAYTSLGYRFERFVGPALLFHSMQWNYLLKRWNLSNAQANVYIKSALGATHVIKKAGAQDAYSLNGAGFVGLAMDMEDRRYFVSYENRYYAGSDLFKAFYQSVRIGIAPYEGNYGDLHTWIMLQLDHHLKHKTLVFTPLLRFFYGVHLFEIGANLQRHILLNYIYRS